MRLSKISRTNIALRAHAAGNSAAPISRWSEMLPKHMLLTEIDEAEAQRLIRDPRWMLQLKADGDRGRFFFHPDKAFAISRRDKPLNLPGLVTAAGKQL